jgi:diguanylate cyclase (GGDEF)-like protein
LGGLLQLRFIKSGTLSDLDQAISELQSTQSLPALPDADRAAVQHNLGAALALRGDLAAALIAAAEAVATNRRLVEVASQTYTAELAMALRSISAYSVAAGSLGLAVLYGKEAAALFQDLGEPGEAVGILDRLGEAHEEAGNIQRAAELYQAALSVTSAMTGRGTQHHELTRAWLEAVEKTAFVPGGRPQIRAVLDESLRRLAAALTAEPFDAAPGYRIGMDLVSAKISSSRALGATITLLGQQLITQLRITHKQASVRLAALLGKLATGFIEAVRNMALAAAEDVSRAERMAWRERDMAVGRKMQQAMLRDRLTGLPNRENLVNRLSGIVTGPSGPDRLGICIINLDGFRAVNIAFGYDSGNRLLNSIAARMRQLTSDSGHFLAHLRADEFAIVVESTTGVGEVIQMVGRVLRSLREPFTLGGRDLFVTASAGIVECAAKGESPNEMLRAAEIALTWAKAHRRGNWVIFDPGSFVIPMGSPQGGPVGSASSRECQVMAAGKPLCMTFCDASSAIVGSRPPCRQLAKARIGSLPDISPPSSPPRGDGTWS